MEQAAIDGGHARRLWNEELYREYDNVLFQHRVKLRRAVVAVDDLQGVWGRWDPLTCTITLSAALIERHAWDVVVEVLKHEIAHQLVTEWYGGDHTHGRFFKDACTRLGVADWASTASGALPSEIPSWRDRALSPEEEKLLRRAEKLLALATSANEHEALLAMERVRELYERHNLERLREQRRATFVRARLGRGRKRVDVADSLIASILVEHFMVQVIFADDYDAARMERHRVLEVFGADENVRMAEYVYGFLYRTAHELWAEYQKQSGKGARAKRSYLVGALTGFREKLRSEAKGAEDAPKPGAGAGGEDEPQGVEKAAVALDAEERSALILRSREELDAFVAKTYPRLRTRSSKRGFSDRASYHAGREAGERIQLRKAVDGAAVARGRLLGAGD